MVEGAGDTVTHLAQSSVRVLLLVGFGIFWWIYLRCTAPSTRRSTAGTLAVHRRTGFGFIAGSRTGVRGEPKQNGLGREKRVEPKRDVSVRPRYADGDF